MRPTTRVVVTGGAGFIGARLCTRLVADGHDVLSIDNYLTGRRANVEHLLGHPRFEALRHDVTMPLQIEADRIYNLACPASPVHYGRDPLQTTRTCVVGALNVLDQAAATGARVLQASTSEVYGDPAVHPQPESYVGHVNPVGPRACYTEGKRCAEALFLDSHRQHGTAVRVARIFNTYGPGMHPDDGRVVSNFVMQALRGEPLTVCGDGRQTRSFCYVDDTVEALVRLMDNDAAPTGPVNLGNPQEISMADLAETVVRLTGAASGIDYVPGPPGDPRRRCPDIGLARQALSWDPRVALEDGLRETIAYFRRLLREG